MGQILDRFCKRTESTHSHWPEGAMPDSILTTSVSQALTALLIHCDSSAMSLTVITDRKKCFAFLHIFFLPIMVNKRSLISANGLR